MIDPTFSVLSVFSKPDPKAKEISIGRKKFNMDPKKVICTHDGSQCIFHATVTTGLALETELLSPTVLMHALSALACLSDASPKLEMAVNIIDMVWPFERCIIYVETTQFHQGWYRQGQVSNSLKGLS